MTPTDYLTTILYVASGAVALFDVLLVVFWMNRKFFLRSAVISLAVGLTIVSTLLGLAWSQFPTELPTAAVFMLYNAVLVMPAGRFIVLQQTKQPSAEDVIEKRFLKQLLILAALPYVAALLSCVLMAQNSNYTL